MSRKRAATPIRGWTGTRWMIVSPWQKFEHTLSWQRKGAWELFRYVVHEDDKKCRKQGFRAIKVIVTFRPVKQ